MNRFKQNKKGFVSIEAILSMSVVIMITILCIGFFSYLFPRVMLQIDVHTLATHAKVQGGLTDISSQPVDSDIELFKDKLVKRGFSRDSIVITAKTIPGNTNAIGVTPINENGNNYIKRDSKELIQITVKVPAQTYLNAPLKFFGMNKTALNYYEISETVMSERW